jgi:hypothetical protein
MFYTYSSDSLPCRLLEYIFALMGENYTGRIVRPINRHLSSNFQKNKMLLGSPELSRNIISSQGGD